MKYLPALLVVLFTATTASFAGSPGKPYFGSNEFERIKSLAGVWKGTTDMGQGPVEMKVEYRVVAGGSAVEERFFAGTPMEMVTMYYEKKGRLALTHYCSLHNQPAMRLKSSDESTIKFDFDPSCGIKARTETHMHSLALTFVSADSIKHDWTLYEAGKPKGSHPFTLQRAAN